jgi:hypothetical protein
MTKYMIFLIFLIRQIVKHKSKVNQRFYFLKTTMLTDQNRSRKGSALQTELSCTLGLL